MRFVFFCVLLIAAMPAQADDAERLAQRLSAFKSLRAAFMQEVRNSQGKVLQSTRGRFVAERPSRFRWEVEAPYKQLIVTNGNMLFIHDVDLDQVVKQSVSDRAGDTPALLLNGDPAKIKQDFSVALKKNAGEKTAGDDERYLLKPKNRDAMFSSLEFRFISGLPAGLSLVDNLGHQTQIQFSQVERNIKPAAALFVFTPPPGVDVIQQ